MTRQLLILIILAAVGASACVTGCAQLPWLQGDEPEKQDGSGGLRLLKNVFNTATESTTTIDSSAQKNNDSTAASIAPVSPKPDDVKAATALQPPPAAAVPTAGRQTASLPPAPPGGTVSPASLKDTRSSPTQYVQAVADSPLRETGREPVVAALEAFLQGRQNDFLEQLKKYDPAVGEVLRQLLPNLARLTQKRFQDLTPAEATALRDGLDKVVQLLLPRTELVIENACFCEWVKAFGNYQPLADSHIFQASSAARPGERIQLYVELRNFDSIKTDGFYETRLTSVVEIRDSKDNKLVWSHSFDDKGHAIRSRSPLHDYFNNYSFYLPALPHGSYTLIIRIVDQTRGESRRKDKSIPFRIGTSQRAS